MLVGSGLFDQSARCLDQVLTNAGWAAAWAALGRHMRPHNASVCRSLPVCRSLTLSFSL
eukprot:COSAG03_NODE_14491_length_462_cov_1.173554_1_plen_58_part_10